MPRRKATPLEQSQPAPASPLEAMYASVTAEPYSVRQRDGFSVSGIGKCAAEQLFALAGFPQANPPSPRPRMVCEMGDHVEQIIVRRFRKAGFVIVCQQKQFVGSEPPREGHIDGLVLWHGKLVPFDAKSANARSFDEWLSLTGISRSSTWGRGWASFDPRRIADTSYRPIRQMYPSYYQQALGYMGLINSLPVYREYRIDNMASVPDELAAAAVNGAVPIATDGFFFWVYCKDDSRMYEEFVPFDEEALNDRLRYLAEGYAAVKGKRRTPALIQQIRQYREVPRNDD